MGIGIPMEIGIAMGIPVPIHTTTHYFPRVQSGFPFPCTSIEFLGGEWKNFWATKNGMWIGTWKWEWHMCVKEVPVWHGNMQ